MIILGALARLWFGSDLDNKILSNRGLQTAFMLLLFLICFVEFPLNWVDVVVAVAASCWLQFEFWSRGHGEIADCGRHTDITEEDIKRYNERWYRIPCDYLLKNHKYGFLYDFLYLSMRYTCPMIPMAFFDWRYILVGLSIAPIYAFSMALEERESWVFKKKTWWWRRGWSLAEMLAGAVVFSSCYWLGL